jgi:hypothetical protein
MVKFTPTRPARRRTDAEIEKETKRLLKIAKESNSTYFVAYYEKILKNLKTTKVLK